MSRTPHTGQFSDEERAGGSSGEDVDEPVFQDQAQISAVNRTDTAVDRSAPSGVNHQHTLNSFVLEYIVIRD